MSWLHLSKADYLYYLKTFKRVCLILIHISSYDTTCSLKWCAKLDQLHVDLFVFSEHLRFWTIFNYYLYPKLSLTYDTNNLLVAKYLSSRKWFKGKLCPKPKLSMFCVLSQNYQHFFEWDISIPKQIVWETQKWR